MALTVSTIVACAWPASYPDGIYTLGLGYRKPYELALYIWLYCIVWFFIQDACKVGLYALIKKYNIFGNNNTGKLVLPESAIKFIRENKGKPIRTGH